MELLAIGQHHGLPTRFLDWTKNPLIAIYFAVEESFEDIDITEFSKIYIHKALSKVRLNSVFDPFEIDTVERFVPKHWDNRIIAQEGLFTVHNKPYEPWEPEELDSVLIHKDIRKAIKTTLNRFGINAGTVYPDLDGLTKHIKWVRSNIH